MSKIKLTQPKILLVEGNHERDFFTAWLQVLHIHDIQVLPLAGKNLLRDNLGAIVNDEKFLNQHIASLVIVRDADDNPQAALQSVTDALDAHHLPSPNGAWQFSQNTTPRVAVIIMPGPNQTGALEELLIQTVQQDPLHTPSLDFIQQAADQLGAAKGQRNPPPLHRLGKARVHAFLSTFEEPDKDQGKAALSGVWDFNHLALQPLRQILEQM